MRISTTATTVEPAPLRRVPTRIAITLAPKTAEGGAIPRVAEPVTMGLPFPRGLCADSQSLALLDTNGTPRALQARALDAWADGSVRWALLDFQADAEAGRETRYDIVVDHTAAQTLARGGTFGKPSPAVTASAEQRGVIVDTGVARFSITPHGPFPFENVSLNGRSAIDPIRTALHLDDSGGEHLNPVIERVRIEEAGPLRTVILCLGSVRGRRAAERLELIARLHFFAGSATVRFALTLRNPQRAGHPGGHWTLGGRGSVYLRDVSVHMAFAGGDRDTSIECSVERGQPYERCDMPFELYQESSGGENWRGANHQNRRRIVPHQIQGYRVRTGTSERNGLRASPVVSASRDDQTMSVALPHFWQNFPKAVEAGRDGLTLRLFPRQSADVHELQGGEQKTHTFFVAFDRDRVTPVPLDWCRSPLLARADPSWYCGSEAVPYLIPVTDDPDRDYVALMQSAIEGSDTFERKREIVDEYGWRHFGDLFADHEAVFQPLVSHYNNQYDAIAGFACQFCRSADPRWWTLMEELAAHVVDIDTYHTDGDKAAYNHGLFWHTYHYVDAGTSGHRSYPNDPKVGGGGPSAEHNYSTGLLLHYFLTGDPLSRDTAIELAQWVVDMDDGRKTVFRWIDGGPTGLASASGSPLYHGPGRAAGNSIVVLLNGHRATGDGRFLAKAEALIRRCIHPSDDLVARNLLDAERRWYYTVFLQALGKYLDCKAELGVIDESYAYARASLLHYATWMVEHEYPYLERPDILEYPTETWAAQDMRKSDVFKFAAKHSDGDARERFLERSDHFFRVSVSTLSGMPTRTLTRPVTLFLTNGLMHTGLSPDGGTPMPPMPSARDFGAPERFVPQKTRALKRGRVLAAAATLMASAAGLLYLLG